MRSSKIALLSTAFGLALPLQSALASPCVGLPPFTDIAQADIFCTDAEWLKNRGISTGCTSSAVYCPNNVVTRASMALFMQRLGTALSPQTLRVDTSTPTANLNAAAPNIACQTVDFPVTGYPRKAIIDSTFAGAANGALEYQHEVYFSTDGGTTWNFTNGNINRNGTPGANWLSSNTKYIQDLDVGTTYRWGTRLGRESGTGNFSSSRCFLNVEILNRTGTATPFDGDVVSGSDH
jgi:hypothetical protein